MVRTGHSFSLALFFFFSSLSSSSFSSSLSSSSSPSLSPFLLFSYSFSFHYSSSVSLSLLGQLHCDIAPRACDNFLRHCKSGYYNGTFFHRLIKGFMVQGGDPTSTGTGGVSAFDQGLPFPGLLYKTHFVIFPLVFLLFTLASLSSFFFFFSFSFLSLSRRVLAAAAA